MADINYPINPEKRDPFYSKNKGDVGLSKTPNMSFSELNNAILANVNNQVNEGTIYHLDKKIGDDGRTFREFPLFKMKSESSYTNVIFGLGEWTGNKEYIGKDCARAELILSEGAINYTLNVSNNNSDKTGEDTDIKWNVNGLPDGSTNNYPETGYTDMTGRGEYPDPSGEDNHSGPVINKEKYLAKTKLRLRRFKSGEGYLVSLVCEALMVDAIWVNLTWCRNIDPVNVVDSNAASTWPDSLFDKEISFYCEKSRISGNLCIEGGLDGIAAYSRSLNHDIPIKTVSNDPVNEYNNNANSHSISNLVPGKILSDNSEWSKENSIREVDIKSNEVECRNPQNIPLSINRLNHQIKFGLNGISVHPSQVESWSNAQTSQSNKRSFIDTDIDPETNPLEGVNNWFPLGISRLTHDINVSAGRGKYEGTRPEEITSDTDTTKGEGYNQYTYNSSDKTMNYVTFSSTATGKGSHYEYDETNESKWITVNDTLSTPDKTKSLDTDTDRTNDLNMVVHGIDHNVLIEVVDKNYRRDRGGACTIDDTSKVDAVSNTAALDNLTLKESVSEPRTETRRNSCATGLFSMNTFDKSVYQCLDIKVHGLDHVIKIRGYRVNVPNPLNVPDEAGDTGGTNQYRKGSNAQDILGDIEIDTYTTRLQKRKLEVIDSRYTDCARGLALLSSNNFLSYGQVSDSGKHGGIQRADYSSAPTINGVPFTGDFRMGMSINSSYTFDSTQSSRIDSQANSNARHIEVAAYHKGAGKAAAGPHKWEVLSTVRNCSYSKSGSVYSHSTTIGNNVNDNPSSNSSSYGLCKLAGFTNNNISGSSTDTIINSFKSYLNGVSGSDDSVITVPILKSLLMALVGSDNKYGIIGSISKDNAKKAGCPIGTIVMWSGNSSDVGTGELSDWRLCTGSDTYTVNGTSRRTPNLTGKFIKAGVGDSINSTGGSTTSGDQSITLTQNNLPNHTHTGTVGSHSHGMTHYHDIKMVSSGKRQCRQAEGQTSNKYIPYLFGPHTLEEVDATTAPSSSSVATGSKSMSNGRSTTDSATASLTINSGGGSSNPSPIVIKEPTYYVLAFIIKVTGL